MWPDAERAKRYGQESYEGHPDIVGVPVHVQVKARAKSTIGRLWREAESVRIERGTGVVTHLVTQDAGHQVLVTLPLRAYCEERRDAERWRRFGEETGSSPKTETDPTLVND